MFYVGGINKSCKVRNYPLFNLEPRVKNKESRRMNLDFKTLKKLANNLLVNMPTRQPVNFSALRLNA